MKMIKYRKKKIVMVSNCCGEPDRMYCYNGPSYSDTLTCPKCKEHCVFEPEKAEDEN